MSTKSKYPNLVAEMTRFGVTNSEVAKAANYDPSTISQWINGRRKSPFPIAAAMRVRNDLFPGMSLEYLFSEEPVSASDDGAKEMSAAS